MKVNTEGWKKEGQEQFQPPSNKLIDELKREEADSGGKLLILSTKQLEKVMRKVANEQSLAMIAMIVFGFFLCFWSWCPGGLVSLKIVN